MPERIITIGDIHGCSTALAALVGAVAQSRTTRLSRSAITLIEAWMTPNNIDLKSELAVRFFRSMDFHEWKKMLIAKNSKIGDYIGGICDDVLVSFWNQNAPEEDVFLFLESSDLVTHNRPALEKAYHCGCCFCFEIFEPSEIREWTDANDTAICPRCHIDSVVPNCTLEQLENIHRVRFSEAF